MKLALVHDWLNNLSGAERVLIELHKMYPSAPIHVLFYDRKFVRKWLPNARIQASFLQRVPFITKLYPLLGPFMPVAIESFDLSQYDRVLSSSAVFSKGLILKPSTKHICYCYSPSRFLWDNQAGYNDKRAYPWVGRIFQHLLRLWDYSAAERVDQFIAISKTVQARLKKYYHRDSIVIYPPVEKLASEGLSPKTNARTEAPYLIVSRLYDHKNVDIAVQAFNKLGYPLVIIGTGPIKRKLESMAEKNIVFLGFQSDATIAWYYENCRAFIMPQEEDFGLTAVEAMLYGKPVIALRRGGATETVIEGQTGEFFDDPIPEGLADALRRFNEHPNKYGPVVIQQHAQTFSLEKFKTQIQLALQ